MDTDSNTFAFYNTAPKQLALDLLQGYQPSASKVKQRAVAKKALKISENCLDAWLILARSYKLFPQASKAYLQAIAIAKKMPSASDSASPHFTVNLQLHKGLGECYLRHKDFSLAVKTFELALLLDPSDPLSVSSELAICYLESDRLDDAQILSEGEPYHSTLSAKVTQVYLLFRQALPEWSADQMKELDYALLTGQTTWQWMHGRCESLKRHYRALNHSNPFLTFFLLNPSCGTIPLPEKVTVGRASEALAVAKAHHHLWRKEELPLRLLEEFPWTNPIKREILEEDKPLLKATISQLEEYREQLRTKAERDYLGDNELY